MIRNKHFNGSILLNAYKKLKISIFFPIFSLEDFLALKLSRKLKRWKYDLKQFKKFTEAYIY